jgi:hypothetical protein
MNTDKTQVIFRVDNTKDFKGTIFALFPYIQGTNKFGTVPSYQHLGTVLSYQHLGQHSSADYKHCIRTSKPATKEQYQELFNELVSQGYDNLEVVHRQNYSKYLKIFK